MASSAMAAGALMYGGSSSSFTLTFSAAARACSSVSAATMAIASPNWNTFSSHRIGRSQPSPLLVAKVIRPVMRFLPLTSLWVMTLATPGMSAAAAVSMERILACDTLAWTSASRRVPGGILSPRSAP